MRCCERQCHERQCRHDVARILKKRLSRVTRAARYALDPPSARRVVRSVGPSRAQCHTSSPHQWRSYTVGGSSVPVRGGVQLRFRVKSSSSPAATPRRLERAHCGPEPPRPRGWARLSCPHSCARALTRTSGRQKAARADTSGRQKATWTQDPLRATNFGRLGGPKSPLRSYLLTSISPDTHPYPL